MIEENGSWLISVFEDNAVVILNPSSALPILSVSEFLSTNSCIRGTKEKVCSGKEDEK